MAILDILEFPDPRLRTKAQPVATVDASIKQLASDMLDTMYAAPGIGLAASQVNVHKRLIVIDHRDCGAYKALLGSDLAKDPVAETKQHGEQLRRFRAEAQGREPGLEIETLLMALDGSVEAVA